MWLSESSLCCLTCFFKSLTILDLSSRLGLGCFAFIPCQTDPCWILKGVSCLLKMPLILPLFLLPLCLSHSFSWIPSISIACFPLLFTLPLLPVLISFFDIFPALSPFPRFSLCLPSVACLTRSLFDSLDLSPQCCLVYCLHLCFPFFSYCHLSTSRRSSAHSVSDSPHLFLCTTLACLNTFLPCCLPLAPRLCGNQHSPMYGAKLGHLPTGLSWAGCPFSSYGTLCLGKNAQKCCLCQYIR